MSGLDDPIFTRPTTPPPPDYDRVIEAERRAAKAAGRGNFDYPAHTRPTTPPPPGYVRIGQATAPRPFIRGPVRPGNREAELLSEALATLEGETGEGEFETGRNHGRPNVARIKLQAREGKKNMAADKVRQRSQLYPRERDAAERAIRPAVSKAVTRALAPVSPPGSALAFIVQQTLANLMGGVLADPSSLGLGTLVQGAVEVVLRGANARWNFMDEAAIGGFASVLSQALLSDAVPVMKVGAVAVWVGLLVAHSRKHRAGGKGSGEADGETGWDAAARRLQGGAAPNPGSPARPAAGDAASASRKRIRPAVAPAFATALDTAVHPDLILGFVRKRGGAPDLAALRQAYVATAARHFAVEFVRTIGSAPKGTSENLALGAIIASSLAQTGQQFPIVPPPAVPAMSVLIHKALQPQLPGLARLAATIAAAPAAPPRRETASREMAW